MKGAHKLFTTRNVENIILEYSPGVGEVWTRGMRGRGCWEGRGRKAAETNIVSIEPPLAFAWDLHARKHLLVATHTAGSPPHLPV